MTITFTFDDSEFTIEAFREQHVFESFGAYAERVVLPLIESDMPQITTLRCSVSGFPVAQLLPDELGDMVRHGVRTLKLNRFDDLLRPHSDQETIDGIESLLDHLMIRMAMRAAPAPSLSYKGDRISEVVLTKKRQTAILLNQLLWDAALTREAISSDEIYNVRIKSFAIADALIAKWDDFPELEAVHALLVELDAKYRIGKLKYSRKEREALEGFRGTTTLPITQIITFIESLIRHRDTQNLDIEVMPTRWTQTVYKENVAYGANERIERSNILKPVVKTESKKPATAEVKEKAAFKRSEKDRFMAAFNAIFEEGK